ncbi:hypothetical protein I5M27_06525 [Adhaeribacter sp. BT258]|uniref:Cupin domain-containing protein n=1 Tax=Adhaeribacter terrigena TaxID=2793070 RepID=A0ABS1BZR8_9BACT|nr:hypothetical protein [Adhaeribacter terrigena]MBK0402632.1 hypothetical protein [Adhaeribacter terrigena]
MNLKTKHDAAKAVSAAILFKGQEGTVTTLQIQKEAELKEHITKVPALLVCVTGKIVYEDESGARETLLSGDFVNIEPMVKHRVNALEDSQLLVIK